MNMGKDKSTIIFQRVSSNSILSHNRKMKHNKTDINKDFLQINLIFNATLIINCNIIKKTFK